MRKRIEYVRSGSTARLWNRRREERTELWTESAGAPPPVYGERWAESDGHRLRAFEPARSKLSAALARGWAQPLPAEGERWLYLGAASGTTASHVADLVGPSGSVYAVERSVRPFARLLHLAERWPNLLPILADAAEPTQYADRVAIVDGIYADIAQADQVAILVRNAELFLDDAHGAVLQTLKTSSMGRGTGAQEHLRAAEQALAEIVPLEAPVRLDPFYRSHYLIGGRRGGSSGPPRRPGRVGGLAGGAPLPSRRRASRRGRSRP